MTTESRGRCPKRNRGKSRGRNRRCNVLKQIAALIVMLGFISWLGKEIDFYAAIHKYFMGVELDDPEYTYHHLPIAQQTPKDELFTPRVKDGPSTGLEADPLTLLHLTKEDKEYTVSQIGSKHFQEKLDEVYAEKKVLLGMDVFDKDIEMKVAIEDDHAVQEQYYAFQSQDDDKKNWECVYQMANGLFDDLDPGDDVTCDLNPDPDDADRVVKSAIVVSLNETYLFERKVEMITISAEKHSEAMVRFVNGKVYYKLADDPGSLSEYRCSLWMMAYAYMKKALEVSDEDEPYYVLIHYYLGNIGYNLLKLMDQTDPFYREIQEEAVAYLELAYSYKDDPRYKTEENMEKDIENMLNDGYLKR